MTRFFFTTIILALCALPAFADDAPANDPAIDENIRPAAPAEISGGEIDRLWDAANTAYINAEYAQAASLYDSILTSGYAGYKLYYNLGNAWFKQDRIGKAVLYYNKSLRLRPSDSDTEHNLKVANTYVRDKIEKVPEFFLSTWIRALRMSFSSNGWAVLSLIFFAVAAGASLVYLLARRIAIRKIGFYTTAVMLGLFVFSLVSGSIERRELTDSRQAIVMISAAPVKSSPEKTSKDIFVLHEGTQVYIVRTLGEWHEIAIADGKRGWILGASIETI